MFSVVIPHAWFSFYLPGLPRMGRTMLNIAEEPLETRVVVVSVCLWKFRVEIKYYSIRKVDNFCVDVYTYNS